MEQKREKSIYAGKTVKIKDGVGHGFMCDDLSGKEFVVEDWCENAIGCSWMNAKGNPSAIEFAMRTVFYGKNNDVPPFSNDVLYGKVGLFGHMFHVNELELEKVDL